MADDATPQLRDGIVVLYRCKSCQLVSGVSGAWPHNSPLRYPRWLSCGGVGCGQNQQPWLSRLCTSKEYGDLMVDIAYDQAAAGKALRELPVVDESEILWMSEVPP